MTLTVVVGGQYGSEGKGKLISHSVASHAGQVGVVRCGGPNAGHTAEGPDGRLLLRQLPSGALHPGCRLFLAAGMQLDLTVLLHELAETGLGPERVLIDGGSTLIESHDADAERAAGLLERVGSTLTGTGAASARKTLREPSVRRAGDVPELKPYVGDAAHELNELLDAGGHVFVEGTQGAGLSLHHGPYPYVTGRDTTAAGFLAEAGLAPMLVTDVVLVLRTYPIRVGGNSGPLRDVTWDDVARRAGYPTALAEYTTVTGRLRRVGEFDWSLARRAVQLNRPTALALHGLDYLDHGDLAVTDWTRLSRRSRAFAAKLERELRVPVRWLFTGPSVEDLVDRGPDLRLARPSVLAKPVHSP